MQRRHHRYAHVGFGEAKTAKYVHFFAQTLVRILYEALLRYAYELYSTANINVGQRALAVAHAARGRGGVGVALRVDVLRIDVARWERPVGMQSRVLYRVDCCVV